MKTMKLGKTGIDISRIGLGTWSIGGGSAWGGDHELQTVVDTIREAPKAGVNPVAYTRLDVYKRQDMNLQVRS